MHMPSLIINAYACGPLIFNIPRESQPNIPISSDADFAQNLTLVNSEKTLLETEVFGCDSRGISFVGWRGFIAWSFDEKVL